MPWDSSTYHPRIPNPKGRLPMLPSAPAARLFGLIGFLLGGYASYTIAGLLLHLPPGWVDRKWTPADLGVIAAILFVCFFGGLSGMALGLKVPADNSNLTRFALILWHFLANGQIVCFFAIGLAWKSGHRPLDTHEALHIFGLFAASTLISGLLLFILGQFRQNSQPQPLLWILAVVPPILWVSHIVRETIHLDQTRAMVFGSAAGLVTIFLSARMIQRDYRQMKDMSEWLAKS